MKKKSKRLLSIFILSMVTFTVLGCGEKKQSSDDTKDDKVVLEFWNYWDGNNGEAMNDLIDTFNSENSDIEVKPIYIPGDQLMTKLQAAISSKTTPSLAAADISSMAKLRSSNTLLQLDDYVDSNNIKLDSFYPALLEYGTQDDNLYALPVSTNNLALFYNKEMFEKAGLDPNSPPETWTQLQDYSEKIMNAIPDTYGFEFYTQVGDSGEGLTWQLQPYLWQTGADFIKDGAAAFNNENGEKSLNYLVGLIDKKISPVGSWNDFEKGTCAMVVDGSWMVGIWKDSANFDFGTSMIPRPEDGQNATNMGGEQIFAFTKSEKENEAATKFIAYITSEDVQVKWDEKTFFMPIRNEVSDNSEYIDWVENTEPRLLPFVEQQKFAHARPSVEEYPACSLAFAKEMEKAYYGETSVKEALSNAEKAVNSALGK
ncbi:MAG: ABC transporter substrate-binding protein [Clostridiaceae bacterium]